MEKKNQYTPLSKVLTCFFILLSLVWLVPVFEVLMNSFKLNTFVNLEPFALPNAETFAGFANYIKGMTFGNYPFLKAALYSLVITVLSVALILLFCSMSAWYIARVNSLASRAFYYLCLFSMIVPFQMVMFTLTFTADQLKLNTPFSIPIVYLGFGAGLAIFMFLGFIKSLPHEIEEAAAIDGASGPQRLFKVTIPMMMPSITICTFLSVVNGFKLFDQNLSLTAGEPSKMSEMLALNIYNTFYGRTGWEGVGQAKAVLFFILVAAIGLIQLRYTRKKEVQQ